MPRRALVLAFPRAMTARRRPIEPSEAPIYSVSNAAFFLGVPPTTLKQWVHGRDYMTDEGRQHSPYVIDMADRGAKRLSFINLAEAHVLDAFRKANFSLPQIRRALTELRQVDNSPHPLINQTFYHLDKRLFFKHLGQLISLSKPMPGQPTIPDLLDDYLQRIQRDDQGRPYRLYPMRANPDRRVMLDLHVAAGQPVLAQRGILAEFIYQRHRTGESVTAIAQDYRIDERSIEAAIAYVAPTKAA